MLYAAKILKHYNLKVSVKSKYFLSYYSINWWYYWYSTAKIFNSCSSCGSITVYWMGNIVSSGNSPGFSVNDRRSDGFSFPFSVSTCTGSTSWVDSIDLILAKCEKTSITTLLISEISDVMIETCQGRLFQSRCCQYAKHHWVSVFCNRLESIFPLELCGWWITREKQLWKESKEIV